MKNSPDPQPGTEGLFGPMPAPAEPEKNGPLAFSYSKFSLYGECPLKYKFKYIDKIKEEPKFYFAFGSAIHKALEFLYAVKAPPFPTIDEVCEAFRVDWHQKSWLEKGYRTPQRAEDDFTKGVAMLRAYYDHNRARLAPPFLVEYSTDVEVDGLKVRIIADKIEHLGGGEILITDYKTGKDVKRQPAQLYMYQKISELDPRLKELIAETYGRRVASVRIAKMLYYHVPTNKEYTFERADDKEIGGFWETVLGVADDIRAKKFDPNPGEPQCNWCDYKKLCPHFADGYPQPAPPPSADGIEALVDRYGRLQERMDELQAELDSVAKSIAASAGRGGEFQGAAYTAEIKKGSRWEFKDREAVISALNRFELYQKALTLTLTGIAGVLDSPGLSEEARAGLLQHAVKKTSYDIKVRKK